MTVRHLLDNTSSAELTEWMALYLIEHQTAGPSADVEDDLRRAFGKKS